MNDASSLKIVAMVSLYNEQDFIDEVIRHLLAQNVHVVVQDNGSTDSSPDICGRYLDHPRFHLTRWNPDGINLTRSGIRLLTHALQLRPDWLVFCDSDEIIEPGTPGQTLADAISEADAEGANLMQCDRFDFFMSGADTLDEPRVTQRLRHYSWQGNYNYRAFRYYPGTYGVPSLAHVPVFPPHVRYHVASQKLVLRHYPYRNPEQAQAKTDTILRKVGHKPREQMTWERRYLRIAEEGQHTQPVDSALLNRFEAGQPLRRDKVHSPFIGAQPTRDALFTADGQLTNRPEATAKWPSGAPGAGRLGWLRRWFKHA